MFDVTTLAQQRNVVECRPQQAWLFGKHGVSIATGTITGNGRQLHTGDEHDFVLETTSHHALPKLGQRAAERSVPQKEQGLHQSTVDLQQLLLSPVPRMHACGMDRTFSQLSSVLETVNLAIGRFNVRLSRYQYGMLTRTAVDCSSDRNVSSLIHLQHLCWLQ